MSQNEIYMDAEAAAQAAREFLAPQYAPFGIQPRVYLVEACGKKVVCLPWGQSKMALAVKKIPADASQLAQGLALMEARFVDTVWWIEGQQEPGRLAALRYARQLGDLGGPFTSFMSEVVSACGVIDEGGSAGK